MHHRTTSTIALNQGFVDAIIDQARQFGVVEVDWNPSGYEWKIHRNGVIGGVSCNQTMTRILYKDLVYVPDIDDTLVTCEDQDYLLDLPSHRHIDHASGRQWRPACTSEVRIHSFKRHAMALCRLALPDTRPLASDLCLSIMSYLLEPEALIDLRWRCPMNIERQPAETRAERRLRRNKRKHEAIDRPLQHTAHPTPTLARSPTPPLPVTCPSLPPTSLSLSVTSAYQARQAVSPVDDLEGTKRWRWPSFPTSARPKHDVKQKTGGAHQAPPDDRGRTTSVTRQEAAYSFPWTYRYSPKTTREPSTPYLDVRAIPTADG
jgi:hypothetical protein